MTPKIDREFVLNYMSDLVLDFMVYDRKNDEHLYLGAINKLIEDGELTIEEMGERFTLELEKFIHGEE